MNDTRTVYVGGSGKTKRIGIGGAAPVSIQTMWKEGISGVLNDRDALFSVIGRIEQLGALGCDILRFAVPDEESADALVKIASETEMPLVADIHFDYKLALRCLEGPVAKIRINPGNIGSKDRVAAVVNRCREKGAAIRIGVNAGSFPRDIAEAVAAGRMTRAEGLAETAVREAAVFDELGFDQVVVSMKASSVRETIEANEAFAAAHDIPLHIGVTEAGPLIGGIVKSTLAFSALLERNIGGTVRVSLSSSPENEVLTAREILRETGKRPGGVKIVSCPRCGRDGFDVHGFVARWQNELMALDKDITVAVMGCVVNGPGEGKHADIGITGAAGKVMIFKHGKIVHTVPEECADTLFRKELLSL
ncbi:(E)-4-hydroxy-3-methylbut-2-enyl-diphosphate synthase [Treponema brennaborense]|uniref:4-hydroxy-3-methylbut-2-en-1-yl diphosphate synthase (flavodoxin) n=1 Tax=Treponema brennaborense (strain DSM 12168 / CIP 105900 / DD5/3) TaxID=906968 RepID=F4LLF4_TREBD|nr:(E)-4-hydroxy-3-methylbut-2-enyl-diphosphate synthase [Treponema brennaborense]AEE16618.1 4-hydroxy-3-methylbut-2-en-1-yl diphosphate synthase [Treponema brennaborense DSM 12168]